MKDQRKQESQSNYVSLEEDGKVPSKPRSTIGLGTDKSDAMDGDGIMKDSPEWLRLDEQESQSNYVNLEDGKVPSKPRPSTNKTDEDEDERHIFWVLYDYARYRNWKKKVLTTILVVASALVFIDLLFFGNIMRWLHSFLYWMEGNTNLAIAAFIGIFIVATLVFIPPHILVFGAGFAFARTQGVLLGMFSAALSCFIGSCLGAVIAFFRARYMMRDLIQLFARRYTIVRALDRAVKKNGFRVLFLLRLCPLIPFSALNYIGGITGVKWEEFTLSLVGILPFDLLLIAMGATASSLGDDDGNADHKLAKVVLICGGFAFGILALVITFFMAKQELEKELEELEKEDAVTEATADTAITEDDVSLRDQGIEAQYQRGVDDEEWFWFWA